MTAERLAYESSKPRWKKPRGATSASKRDDPNQESWLLCARCGEKITPDDARTERAGLHEHSQVNPHGYIWVFGCFDEAPGCRRLGRPTSEFSWFVGYQWQLCECASCALHLGWHFHADDDQFWGLILERLVA